MTSMNTNQQNILVLWDFDNSMINENVDYWIPGTLWTKDFSIMREMRKNARPFTKEKTFSTLMGSIFEELFKQGVTDKDYQELMKKTPVFKENLEVIRNLHILGIEQKIVSDANSYFIETFLEIHDIRKCFSEIRTHPAKIDEFGKLVVTEWTDTHPLGERCKYFGYCGHQMCKAEVVNGIPRPENARIIYIGDGSGDFCGVRVLKACDFAFVREGFSLEKDINENEGAITCQIRTWKDGKTLKKQFQEICKGL